MCDSETCIEYEVYVEVNLYPTFTFYDEGVVILYPFLVRIMYRTGIPVCVYHSCYSPLVTITLLWCVIR